MYYTENQMEAFTNAFYGTMQLLVPEFDMDEDLKTPTPWGCPWLFAKEDEYMRAYSSEESGILWAHYCAPDISRALKMERETM